MRTGPPEEPLGIDGRKVHASVTSYVSKRSVPERSVQADAFGEVLHPRHILHAVVPMRAFVFEVVHVGREEFGPDAKRAARCCGGRAFATFAGGNECGEDGLLAFVRDERLRFEVHVDPSFARGDVDFGGRLA